ncbi:MAG: amidohydrolase [bacterium]|nr:amidohydrolase [bacterium]
MSILIKNVWLEEQVVTLEIQEDRIHAITSAAAFDASSQAAFISSQVDKIIDGQKKLRVLPALFNGHTHAAMTLFRSYGDDLPLMRWLQEKVWPLEASITETQVEWGMRLACLEMIKTGCTGFCDMYWHFDACARIVEEVGLHGVLSGVFVDLFDSKRAKAQQQLNGELYESCHEKYPKYVRFAIGPHAIYTVSEDSLRWASEFTAEKNIPFHTHLSETRREIDECRAQHNGLSPVEYLHSLNILSPRLKAAHVIHVDERDRALLAEHGVTVIHNPSSNMKLAVGGPFNLKVMKAAGIVPVLGTDGAGSNNSLDLFTEMKIAALLQKHAWSDPEQGAAHEIWRMPTIDSWRQFGYDAGEVAVGKLAELILIRTDDFAMIPNHDYISNLVYSANGTIVDTTISSGRVLMEGGVVAGEQELLQEFRDVAHHFVNSH